MDKNCLSALIARKMIEAIYGYVEDSYEVYISDYEYDDLDEDEKTNWHGEYDYDEDGNPELWEYSRCIDRNIWFGKISGDCGNIVEREEILKSLDVETVKHELQMRYNALQELPNYNHYNSDDDYMENVSLEIVKEIVMWTRNGFIS